MVQLRPASSGYQLQTAASFSFALIGIVLYQVSLQLARLCAGVVALFAGKGFVTSVGEPVHL